MKAGVRFVSYDHFKHALADAEVSPFACPKESANLTCVPMETGRLALASSTQVSALAANERFVVASVAGTGELLLLNAKGDMQVVAQSQLESGTVQDLSVVGDALALLDFGKDQEHDVVREERVDSAQLVDRCRNAIIVSAQELLGIM